MKVLGLMTGTSMDGLDCCLAEIYLNSRYDFKYKILDYNTYQYNHETLTLIKNIIGFKNKKKLLSAHNKLGLLFKNISEEFLKGRIVDIISSHGQTVYHKGKIKSIQIGNPKYMYEQFNIPIIYNFREKDIMHYGEGAPLAPFLDWLLFKNLYKNTICLNIGGVANISFISKKSTRMKVIGFDTGPGMSLIDEFVQLNFNNIFDENCMYSKKGVIDIFLLNELMNESFIYKKPPKSTGREYFGIEYLSNKINKKLNITNFNILRTLVKYTACSILKNIELFIGCENVDQIIVSGGGAKHRLLMNDLKKSNKKIFLLDKYNISIHCKEAFLMAVMGVAAYKNIPNNMPAVTGVKSKMVYGEVYEP